jgi:hypothetical protein
MPWVRFDDHYPVNRKVDGLSDTAFRLHTSAIFWCARNLTDGAVPEGDLELVTARVRAPLRFATELVSRGLWHEAGYQCDSEDCPPSSVSGWVIHDYFEYQPTKQKVVADRADNAERQRKYRERQASQEGNEASNGVTNGEVTRPRPVPVPKEPKDMPQPDGFDEFWTVYPRKKAKDAARKAYDAAVKRGGDPAEILDGVVAYRDECRRERTEERFIAHAATWLNQGRWKDHVEAAKAAPVQRELWPWEQ